MRRQIENANTVSKFSATPITESGMNSSDARYDHAAGVEWVMGDSGN